jgi:hypothetical protein
MTINHIARRHQYAACGWAAAALLWAFAACSPAKAADPTQAPDSPRAQLSIGYSLLYQEADGIPKLNWLLMFKKKDAEMSEMTDDLVSYYQRLAGHMERLSRQYPGMRIDAAATSEIEGEARKAIGKDLAKDLAPIVGRTGKDVEREALQNFYDGLNEQRHLVGVMQSRETVPGLKMFLRETQTQLDDWYEKIGALLNRRYFLH